MQCRLGFKFYNEQHQVLGETEKLITLGSWADDPFKAIPFQTVIGGAFDEFDHMDMNVMYFGKPIENLQEGGIE